MTLDRELVEALETDYTTAPITPQEQVMVDYVVKLTKDATKVWKDDIEGLRAVGFDDRGILQITLIASWFNYINRVADALRMAAESLSDSDSYLGARYRKYRGRMEGKKAVKTMAHYLACLVYRLLRKGQEYVDRGAAYFEKKRTEREMVSLKRKAAELGMQLVPA